MTRFHKRTLALLGRKALPKKRSVHSLLGWAAKNEIILPKAFLEWATLDNGTLLQKYSNDDRFWFDKPKVVVTPEGIRGLLFNQENQGNFDRIVCLDQGDDPPVLFAWIGRPPWVKNAERFSDAVYAEVFDWQYWLEFKPDNPAYKEITYYGELNFKTDGCLATLRTHYEETVTTSFTAADIRYTEYRFIKSAVLRLTVLVAEPGSTNIRVTGHPMEAVKGLEAELRSVLGRKYRITKGKS